VPAAAPAVAPAAAAPAAVEPAAAVPAAAQAAALPSAAARPSSLSSPSSSPPPAVALAGAGAFAGAGAAAGAFGGETFYGGVTSLAAQLDRRVMVVLTDGRHVLGDLASYDQFGSLVLERAVERHFARGRFCDDEMGVYLVRGENVCLVGEVDAALEAAGASPLVRAEHREVVLLEEAEAEERRRAAGGPAAAGGMRISFGVE